MAKQPNIIELIRMEIQKELTSIKRRKRKLKLKVILTLILPAVIVLLAVKTAQTYIKIRLNSILVLPPADTAAEPKPAPAQRFKPEFLTPDPVPTQDVQQTVVPETASHIIITELTEDV